MIPRVEGDLQNDMLGCAKGGRAAAQAFFGRQFLREPQVIIDMDVRGRMMRAMESVNRSTGKTASPDSMKQHLETKGRGNGGKRRTRKAGV